MKKVLIIMIAGLLLASCGKDDKSGAKGAQIFYIRDTSSAQYSIFVGEYQNEAEAESKAEAMLDSIDYDLYVETVEDETEEKYLLTIGAFENAYNAGKVGHTFFKDGLLKDYKILKGRIPINNYFRNFIFVGSQYGVPILFRLDLDKLEYEKYWSDGLKRVVNLSYSEDRSKAFFITAYRLGVRSELPFIRGAELYHLDLLTEKISKIDEFQEGIQIISYWTQAEKYRVMLKSIDKKLTSQLIKSSRYYDKHGSLMEEEEERYDLLDDGFPEAIGRATKTVSDNERFLIKKRADSLKNVATVTDVVSGKELEIIYDDQNIKKIEWVGDSLLVFSTINESDEEIAAKETSKLFLVDLIKMEIQEMWGGGGEKNFQIRGEYLIFDSGYNADSKIFLFDLNMMKIIKEISILGGCGLYRIP